MDGVAARAKASTPAAERARRRVNLVAEVLERRSDRVMVVVCVLLTVVGAAAAVHEGKTLKFFDERQYVQIAGNLAHHGVFSINGHTPTAYRPPTWPLFLGLLRFLGAGVVAMRVVNVLLLVAAVFILYRVVSRWTRPIVGIAAGVLVACYPLLVYTATTLYPQTSALLLLVVVLWLVGREGSRPAVELALAGIALGVLVLDVTTFAYLLPFLPLFSPRRRVAYLKGLGLVAAGTILVIGVWTVRNEIALHHLFFVSTNGGTNLLLGNSPHAGADTGVSANIAVYTEHAAHLSGEVAQNNYYQHEALSWITHHPTSAAHLYVLKLLNFFNSDNTLATAGAGSSLQGALLTAYYAVLGMLLVARVALWSRVRWHWLSGWCLAVYLVGAVVSAVFFTRVRLRGPYDVLLIIAIAPLACLLFTDRGSPDSGSEDLALVPEATSVDSRA